MPFIAANGLTEEETSKTVQVGGVNVHFHDIGQGEPIIFFHSYGPGITAWINWHKVAGALANTIAASSSTCPTSPSRVL